MITDDAPLEKLASVLRAAGVALRPLGSGAYWTRLRPLFDVAGVRISGLTPRDVGPGDEIAFSLRVSDDADWLATPSEPGAAAAASLQVGEVCFALRRVDARAAHSALRPLGVKLGEGAGHLAGRAGWFRRRS